MQGLGLRVGGLGLRDALEDYCPFNGDYIRFHDCLGGVYGMYTKH